VIRSQTGKVVTVVVCVKLNSYSQNAPGKVSKKLRKIVKLRTFCTYVAYCHCGVLPQGVDEFIFRYFNGLTLIATNYCGHCPGERMIKF